jgi:hypothetical protein
LAGRVLLKIVYLLVRRMLGLAVRLFRRDMAKDNAFAAELLMPRDLTRSATERTLSKRRDFTPPELVGILAKRFEVSAAAMQYRLINLEILNPYSLADWFPRPFIVPRQSRDK